MQTELRVVTAKRVDLVLAMAALYKLLRMKILFCLAARITTNADLGSDPRHEYSPHNGIHRAAVLISQVPMLAFYPFCLPTPGDAPVGRLSGFQAFRLSGFQPRSWAALGFPKSQPEQVYAPANRPA